MAPDEALPCLRTPAGHEDSGQVMTVLAKRNHLVPARARREILSDVEAAVRRSKVGRRDGCCGGRRCRRWSSCGDGGCGGSRRRSWSKGDDGRCCGCRGARWRRLGRGPPAAGGKKKRGDEQQGCRQGRAVRPHQATSSGGRLGMVSSGPKFTLTYSSKDFIASSGTNSVPGWVLMKSTQAAGDFRVSRGRTRLWQFPQYRIMVSRPAPGGKYSARLAGVAEGAGVAVVVGVAVTTGVGAGVRVGVAAGRQAEASSTPKLTMITVTRHTICYWGLS